VICGRICLQISVSKAAPVSEYYKVQEDARYKPNVLKRLTDFEPFVKKRKDDDGNKRKRV